MRPRTAGRLESSLTRAEYPGVVEEVKRMGIEPWDNETVAQSDARWKKTRAQMKPYGDEPDAGMKPWTTESRVAAVKAKMKKK